MAAAGSSAETLVMYILLRGDLKGKAWNTGALVAQACHASTAVLCTNMQHPNVIAYLADVDRMHKVVLKVDDEPSLRAVSSQLNEAQLIHKLWVEQPEDQATALAILPYPKPQLAQYLDKLKLFRN